MNDEKSVCSCPPPYLTCLILRSMLNKRTAHRRHCPSVLICNRNAEGFLNVIPAPRFLRQRPLPTSTVSLSLTRNETPQGVGFVSVGAL